MLLLHRNTWLFDLLIEWFFFFGFFRSTHDWLRTGDLVNIVGVAEDENRSFELDTGFGFLVLEPDRLIAPTSILSMMYCERKAALTSRFYMGGGDNIHMFRGTLAHELIGQVR